MSQAKETVAAYHGQPGGFKTLALKAGAFQEISSDPAYEFAYHFPDGSTALTKGRGVNYQLWVSGELA